VDLAIRESGYQPHVGLEVDTDVAGLCTSGFRMPAACNSRLSAVRVPGGALATGAASG
jgi:hypothetical protein